MKRLLLILLACVALPIGAQEVVEVIEVVEAVEQDGPSRAELFRQADPHGIVMAVMAISVVMIALALLYLIFKGIGLLFRKIAAPKPVKEVEVAAIPPTPSFDQVESGVFAAIACALFQYSRDLHDVENTVLTINRGAKAYSPWSSKIYGLRQIPDKK